MKVVIASFSFPPVHLLTFQKASAGIKRTNKQHLVFDFFATAKRKRQRLRRTWWRWSLI